MFYDVFKKENVVKFFKDISSGEIYKTKDIPTSMNNELVDKSYYPILIGLDAIMKYVIIIEDLIWFDEYLKEVQLLLRKVNNHTDIKIGINKLIINYTKLKLRLENITSRENKEEIIKYIYKKYIVDGYYFHSFPSIFINDVQTNGLLSSNYNYEIESLKEVNSVFKKYKTYNVFSKELTYLNKIYITDSPFMGCFYAYNSPNFLKELSLGLTDIKEKCMLDSFFMKDYSNSKRNLNHFIKKVDMFNIDSSKVIAFLDKEWDLFNINESFPVMAKIKRSYFKDNYLVDINNIIDDGLNNDLVSAVTKILNVNSNQKVVNNDIPSSEIELIYLPTINELGIETNNKKQNTSKDSNIMNDYGSSTIIATLGIILVALGLVIYFIMLG